MVIPPPEQRLCKKHSRPIRPSNWLRGCRNNGCARCFREYNKSFRVRKKREIKWENSFIICINHPDRRCNKSSYIYDGHRNCQSCVKRRSDGTKKPSHQKRCTAEFYRGRRARKLFQKDPLKYIHKQMRAHSICVQRIVNA